MVIKRAVSKALGIWALSCIPTTAAALSWIECTTDAAGVRTCHTKLSRSAQIMIVIVLLLLFSLVVCAVHNRRAAASDQEYNMEAIQVHGPPTIIATEYNPTSGPSGIYGPEGPRSGFRSGQTSAQMTGPAYPIAAQVYNQHRTAPQATFPDQPYPFTGYSPHMGPPVPQTAFVSSEFPRALLAGTRLKDKLKERPASVSHTLK